MNEGEATSLPAVDDVSTNAAPSPNFQWYRDGSATDGQTVRLPPALMQPIVSDDVAAALAEIAVAEPLNGTVELAGPEPIQMDELVRRYLSANRDARKVTTDVHAGYFGTAVNDQSLTPGDHPRLGPTRFEDSLRRSRPQRQGHIADGPRPAASVHQ